MIKTDAGGRDWNGALQECRNGPGFLPDLASVANADEMGEYINLIYFRVKSDRICLFPNLSKADSN